MIIINGKMRNKKLHKFHFISFDGLLKLYIYNKYLIILNHLVLYQYKLIQPNLTDLLIDFQGTFSR